ncbi:MAG: aspartate aminotransferase, partial [Nitrospirota bacterium]
MLSERAGQIKPSPTLAIDAKAKAMKASGVDVVNFGVGEPDFDTPDNIKEAAIKAIKEGFT